MDAQASWRAFACTGNILRYLDYKQQVQQPDPHPAEEVEDGNLCNTGAGAEGNKI